MDSEGLHWVSAGLQDFTKVFLEDLQGVSKRQRVSWEFEEISALYSFWLTKNSLLAFAFTIPKVMIFQQSLTTFLSPANIGKITIIIGNL